MQSAPHTAAPDAVLSIRSISKSFGVNKVLRGLTLDVLRGEVVGLMGPNGAGKSTLIKILDGLYRPDAGTLWLDGGEVVHLRDQPTVGILHQDLGLIDDLSISDNLRLGQPAIRRWGTWLDVSAEREHARRDLAGVGLDRGVQQLVGELSPGEKTLVALARLQSRGARLVIVDEATSTLPPAEAALVLKSLRDVAARGGAVVLVSHKLNEILDGTDRVVVMLDGKIAVEQLRSRLDRTSLVELLLEHDTGWHAPKRTITDGPVALELIGAGSARCGPLDLAVRAGEIVGLTGLPGSGLHDIALMVAGSQRPTFGRIERRSPVAIVPPQRETQGGFDDLTTGNNLTIGSLRRWRRPFGLLNVASERADSTSLLSQLHVSPPGPDQHFGTLSGGNKQKVIFGRAVMTGNRILVLCEPTRGVDVRTRYDLYRLIVDIAESGVAILITSSDAEDLLAVCDRVGVVRGGRTEAVRPLEDLEAEQIEALV